MRTVINFLIAKMGIMEFASLLIKVTGLLVLVPAILGFITSVILFVIGIKTPKGKKKKLFFITSAVYLIAALGIIVPELVTHLFNK
ncbi:MAG: hypothetical protein LBR54_05280 [Oscillospiraceae bacterium]|jgi:uncharacterized membrane protein|nr:hypothetical protein [Oscillospiraceae bacterium]